MSILNISVDILLFMFIAIFYLLLYIFIRIIKKPLNLLVDEDLVKKARDHGLNLSKFFEN